MSTGTAPVKSYKTLTGVLFCAKLMIAKYLTGPLFIAPDRLILERAILVEFF